jgi:acyl carrier protein
VIRDDAPLTDYGLDSMLAVQAVEVLNTTAGTALTTTSLFDHPTVDALVAHLLSTSGIAVDAVESVQAVAAEASPPRAAAPAVASAPAPRPTASAATGAAQAIAQTIARGIAQALVDVAGLDAGDIRGDVPFTDYGVDSMLAVQIVEVLNQRLAVELTTTSLFDHPTLDALVAHLAGGDAGTAGGIDFGATIASAPQAPAAAAASPTMRATPAAPGGALRRQVLQSLADVLEIEAAEIDAQTPFTDYGLDSMLAVQWVERLNQSLQLELTTTSPFDHPTLDALMAHLLAGRDDETAPVDAAVPETPAVAQPKRRPQPMSYTI